MFFGGGKSDQFPLISQYIGFIAWLFPTNYPMGASWVVPVEVVFSAPNTDTLAVIKNLLSVKLGDVGRRN